MSIVLKQLELHQYRDDQGRRTATIVVAYPFVAEGALALTALVREDLDGEGVTAFMRLKVRNAVRNMVKVEL